MGRGEDQKERKRKLQADSMLSEEFNAELNLIILRLQAEQKPRVIILISFFL